MSSIREEFLAYMLPIRDLWVTAFCLLLSVVFYENNNKCGITFHATHERSFRVRCRHRSTSDQSLDGDTVDGATIVGRDPAFIQPVDPRVLY